MKPIAPSGSQCDILRGIAGAGFEYSATKRLCAGAGWALVEDEPDAGFLQFSLAVGLSLDDRRLLSVGTREIDGTPHLLLPLFYFPEEEGRLPGDAERTPFDDAFRRLCEGLCIHLGEPSQRGTYEHRHRPGWRYHHCTWRVPEAQVLLLQDERDIQFGMDVSMWLFAADRKISVPLRT